MKLLKHFFVDLSPLKQYPDYRRIFWGQLISSFGSMITYVAIPYQIYEMTKSTAMVGFLGIVQLVPLVFSAFAGGAYADSKDRKKTIIWCEILLAFCCLGIGATTLIADASVYWIFILAATSSWLYGFHRPALEAMTPKLVAPEDIPRISPLNSLKRTFGMVAGPSIGGILIASGGLTFTYAIDAASYIFSIICILRIQQNPKISVEQAFNLQSIKEGFAYAMKRPVLLGTYFVDMIAMTFAFPTPLFPALAQHYGGPKTLGPLYAAASIGALIASTTSTWTTSISRHGKIITLSAILWCLGIVGFGFSNSLWVALGCLGFAGYVDMVSGIFRSTVWNQTIPDHYRGRMAGIEMLSYMSGPLLGNTVAGYAASITSPQLAPIYGGLIGTVGIVVCVLWLKPFWHYVANPTDFKNSYKEN